MKRLQDYDPRLQLAIEQALTLNRLLLEQAVGRARLLFVDDPHQFMRLATTCTKNVAMLMKVVLQFYKQRHEEYVASTKILNQQADDRQRRWLERHKARAEMQAMRGE